MEPAPAVPMYHINTAIRCTHCLGPPRPSNSSWEPPQHSLAVELAYKSFGGWLEQQLEVAANPTSDPAILVTAPPMSLVVFASLSPNFAHVTVASLRALLTRTWVLVL